MYGYCWRSASNIRVSYNKSRYTCRFHTEILRDIFYNISLTFDHKHFGSRICVWIIFPSNSTPNTYHCPFIIVGTWGIILGLFRHLLKRQQIRHCLILRLGDRPQTVYYQVVKRKYLQPNILEQINYINKHTVFSKGILFHTRFPPGRKCIDFLYCVHSLFCCSPSSLSSIALEQLTGYEFK